jgi:hypothetical protein
MQFNMLADCLAEGSTPNMFNQASSRASVEKKKSPILNVVFVLDGPPIISF